MLPFFKIVNSSVDMNKGDSDLETFMNSIINRFSDYKCFVNIFELLKIEHKQNYMFKRRNPSKVYTFVYSHIISKPGEDWQEKLKVYLDKGSKGFNELFFNFSSHSKDNNICKLVSNMYEYCVEYLIALTEDNNLFEEVSNIIDNILTVLKHINNKSKFLDRFIFELLLDMIPVLEFYRHHSKNWGIGQIREFIRILYIVTEKFNNYGLEACTCDDCENLFFNDINYDTMGDHNNEKQEILKQWLLFIPNIKESDTSNLPDLYYSTNIIKNFCAGTVCNKCIWLNWKGELKTIYEISKIVQLDILDPYYFYALYDVYFKFHMALLYYNFRLLLNNLEEDFETTNSINFGDLIGYKTLSISNNILYGKFSIKFNECVQNSFEEVENIILGKKINFEIKKSCIDTENIMTNLGIYMFLPFQNDNTKSSISEHKKNVCENEYNSMNDFNKFTNYLSNRKTAINLISEVRAEYEKLIEFYNYIN